MLTDPYTGTYRVDTTKPRDYVQGKITGKLLCFENIELVRSLAVGETHGMLTNYISRT
jgi:hypothetical protein